jgi:hypothetical protein
MFTPIGFFAPQVGGLPNIVTDGLQIWADPNHSEVVYTSGVIAGTIQNLAPTGFNITFGDVTSTPFSTPPTSFLVGDTADKYYFLPNGSHPYANNNPTDQGFVDLNNTLSMEAWFYFPTGITDPYYYNFEGHLLSINDKFPTTSNRSFLVQSFRRWSDAANRYKFFETVSRNNANVQIGTSEYPIGGQQFNDGLWHHLVVTKDAIGVVKTYLDGVDQSIDFTMAAGLATDSTLTYFGATGGGDYRPFQGGARGGSFRYYNKALSAAEVLQNYNAEDNTFGA